MGRKKIIAPSFQQFWDAYALQRDRYKAEPVWDRMTAKDKVAAIAGIAAYKERCRRQGVAVAYGCTYLSHRRWKDKDDAVQAGAKPSAKTDKPKKMLTW
jgi:hypothetical protein